MDRNAAFWQCMAGTLPMPAAARTLGANIIDVDAEAGTITVEFLACDAFTNPAGHVQGGFLAAMLDDTLGPVLAATLRAGQFAPTLSLSVQFLATARPGPLTGHGRIERRGREIGHLTGRLEQNGRVVATATAVALIRPAST